MNIGVMRIAFIVFTITLTRFLASRTAPEIVEPLRALLPDREPNADFEAILQEGIRCAAPGPAWRLGGVALPLYPALIMCDMRPKNPNIYLLPEAPYYCVVDLEATCDNQDPPVVARDEMETIEIGAVMVDGRTLAPVGELQAFIRPVRNPKLTEFCTALTTITQGDVDQACAFPEAFAQFLAWANGFPGWRFASWGAYDTTQIRRDCAFWGIDPPWPWNESLNLKRLFARQKGNIKECGIPAALSILKIPPMTGTHHRGIDDARNIARILPSLKREPT
jgi:inhibitor of KinA sporulation pathway (predicted exonuclease)